MRTRLMLAAAAVGALTLALPAAIAAPATPVLDGKKVTKLEIKGNGGMQANADNPVPAACPAGRCIMLPFVYAPAKGVPGGVLFQLKWDNAVASDMDLYVAEVGKSGSLTEIGNCASFGPAARESYYTPAGTLKKGKTYALLIDFYRSVNDNVVGTVTMPAANPIPKTTPANVDGVADLNCTL